MNNRRGNAKEERKEGEGEREGWGCLTDVELQRFRGQTNKQTTHRFPATLRHSWGTLPPLASAVRLRSSPLTLRTVFTGGSPSPPPLHRPPAPLFSLVNSITWTSLGDGASEVNHHERLVITLWEEVRAYSVHLERRINDQSRRLSTALSPFIWRKKTANWKCFYQGKGRWFWQTWYLTNVIRKKSHGSWRECVLTPNGSIQPPKRQNKCLNAVKITD